MCAAYFCVLVVEFLLMDHSERIANKLNEPRYEKIVAVQPAPEDPRKYSVVLWKPNGVADLYDDLMLLDRMSSLLVSEEAEMDWTRFRGVCERVPLEELHLSLSVPEDGLKAIACCRHLKSLEINKWIDGRHVRHLSAMQSLESICIDVEHPQAAVEAIATCGNVSWVSIDSRGSERCDLSPLSNLKNLTTLNFSVDLARDLTPFANTPITRMIIKSQRLDTRQLESLRQIRTLRTIEFGDLSGNPGCILDVVCGHPSITSVSAHGDLKLTEEQTAKLINSQANRISLPNTKLTSKHFENVRPAKAAESLRFDGSNLSVDEENVLNLKFPSIQFSIYRPRKSQLGD
jgi:hypothetical protein